jgi:uncharacterized membrane protein YoaK (UPF0700 family)
MMENKNQDGPKTKNMFAALGLIFGSAVGAALSLVITGNVIWGLIGTAVGLVIGAAIDSRKREK